MSYDRIQPSLTRFFGAVNHGMKCRVWSNEPHSLGYERTGGEVSVAVASTQPCVTHTFQCWAEYCFLYMYIAEQCLANNIKHKKIGMVSPTYMVEQCLEKQPEFDL